MENYKNESMVDAAYSLLKDYGDIIKFSTLYEMVCEKKEFTKEEIERNISNFYTDLTLDGRFVNVGNNKWDLRVNQKYEKAHIDMNDVYTALDEEVIENRDVEEYTKEELESLGDESLDSSEDEEDAEYDYDNPVKDM